MKKLLTRTLAMVMTLVMLLSMAVFTTSAEEILPSEDFEEEDGVFHIENASDMMAFAGMAGWYGYYAGKTVSIDANIDMTGASWSMVGSFKGILEGNGNCIKNLKITANGQVSIFKELNGATVRNLRFLDCSVTSAAGTTGGLAVLVSGETLIENVYMHTTVDTGTAVRPAGFFGYTNIDADVTFRNCVSDATLKGDKNGGGFIAQHANKGAKAEFIDCAFIGDMTAVGKRTTGFIGITDADTKLTRCICFGKNNDTVQTGDFLNLVQQNAQKPNKTKIELIDCYGLTNIEDQVSVILELVKGMDISVTYGSAVLFTGEAADADTAISAEDQATFQSRFKYLIKGTTSNFEKDTFKTMYPSFADWTVTDVEVEYAQGKTITAVLPTSIVTLLAGSTDVPTAGGQTPDGGDEQTPGDNQTPGANNNTETQAPETTDTEAATTAAQTEATKDKGCGGVIGVGAVVVMAVAGAAVVATRKKED